MAISAKTKLNKFDGVFVQVVLLKHTHTHAHEAKQNKPNKTKNISSSILQRPQNLFVTLPE